MIVRRTRFSVALAAALLLAGASVATAGGVWLGITMDEISPSMARALGLDEERGVLIDDVVDGSPAAQAGLEPGDVILSVAGEEVADSKDLVRAIQRFDPGDEIDVDVLRGGQRESVTVTLGERESKRSTVWRFGGKEGEVREFAPQVDAERLKDIMADVFGSRRDRGYLGIVPGGDDEDGETGVVVASLTEDGPAARAGLEVGDRIIALDGEPIDDRTALREFLEEADPGQDVTVTVMRDGDRREIDVELADTPGRIVIGDYMRAFPPDSPSAPRPPRFFEFHATPDADVEVHIDSLARDREELARLREELEQLRKELQKLREDLPENSGKDR
jgi:predicted metalloprotease with PDZ domain